MAELIIRKQKILDNITKLSAYLDSKGIKWSLTTKVLSGHKKLLEFILKSLEMEKIHSVADSRLSNLEMIKKITPDIKTMYIKPTAIQYTERVVKVADISLNTSYETIQALNEAALAQDKIHKVIIMIELGELREGVMREDLINFYRKCYDLPNIEIIGLGTNLGCMYGIEPTFDKLVQLALYKQLIEAIFSRKINLISGGSSITLPLIVKKKVPGAVNHFRIGEAIFLGDSPLNGKKFRNLSSEAFEFQANIIEFEQKDNEPDGVISEGNVGHAEKLDLQSGSFKAILDFGVLDVNPDDIFPKDKNVRFIGTTSDMTVYDLGKLDERRKRKYKVGSKIKFHPDYMAVARLMNSKFISKRII